MRLVYILTILILSSLGHAFYIPPQFRDQIPTLEITTHDKTDTSVKIKVEARDMGWDMWIENLKLLEDGNIIIEKFDCTALCKIDQSFNYNEKGYHTYKAIATDKGDHKVTKYVRVYFQGLERPPQLFIDDGETEEGKHIEIPINAHDPNNDIVAITHSRLPRGAVYENNIFSWTPDFDQAGTHRITFTATDSKNHKTSKTLTINVLNINRMPVIESVQPGEGNIIINENTEILFSINVLDEDTEKPGIKWFLNDRIVSHSDSYRFQTDFTDAGLYTLIVIVSDDNYRLERTWAITVNNVNRRPVITSIPDKEIKEGETVRFRVTAKDPDKDELIYNFESPVGTFDPSTRIFEWITEEGNGGRIYRVKFTVSDSQYKDSEVVEITVNRKSEFEKMIEEYLRGKEVTVSGISEVVSVFESVKTTGFIGFIPKEPAKKEVASKGTLFALETPTEEISIKFVEQSSPPFITSELMIFISMALLFVMLYLGIKF